MSGPNAGEGDMDAYYGAQASVFRNWGSSFECRLKSAEDRVAYGQDIRRLEASIGQHISEPGTVVEVGCGPSRLRNLDKNRPLVLVDRVLAMLREARSFHGDHLRSYIQADGRQLPLANGSATLVVCTFVLSHMDDAGCQGTVREIQRVLAPGGVAIVADSARSIVATRDIPAQRRTAANGLAYSVLKYYRSVDQVRGLFTGGAFAASGNVQFVFTIEWRNV